jgi:hypothetical protein
MQRRRLPIYTRLCSLLTGWALGALVVLVLAPGCLVSDIDELCQEIAETQCDQCFACANEAVPADDTCGLTTASSPEACVEDKQARCSGQASTVERPKEDLNACIDSQVNVSCPAQREQAVRGATPATQECVYFL